jgi:hypothetical protein
MLERNSGAKVSVPACITGTKGVKAGVKSSVDSRAGNSVSIALFDGTHGMYDRQLLRYHFDVKSFSCI